MATFCDVINTARDNQKANKKLTAGIALVIFVPVMVCPLDRVQLTQESIILAEVKSSHTEF
jgi:hypothetical protein